MPGERMHNIPGRGPLKRDEVDMDVLLVVVDIAAKMRCPLIKPDSAPGPSLPPLKTNTNLAGDV
jgi:hypothetical protein